VDFLKGVVTDLGKDGFELGASEPPRYWYSTGNYVLNRIISGRFDRGIPQGRITSFTGPSGSGKSFNACNAMREAQKKGALIVVLDSENALDNEFVQKIGVDTDSDNYMYYSVSTIPECKKIVSRFTEGYRKQYGDRNPDAPELLFVIDSLDMLMTETEVSHYQKGASKGDQGQRNKQLKAMLREFVQAIKFHNIAMIITSQVYRNQDVTNGEGVWIVSDAVRYSLSQIVLLTKLKLKEDSDVIGIRMKCESFKTRFSQPHQHVVIEVPYETGIDPYNGLLEVAVQMGEIIKKGPRYVIKGEDTSWFAKNFSEEQAELVLSRCSKHTDVRLQANMESEEIDLTDTGSAKSKRMKKAQESITPET